MKRTLITLACLCFASMAFAQTTADDFESYADGTALNAVWAAKTGYTACVLQTTGGADATAKSLKITDAGYSNGVISNDLVSPPSAGNYKLTFKYMNGQTETPWNQLNVNLIQNSVTVATWQDASNTVVNTWTAAETNFAALTTAPIKIQVVGPANLPAENNTCAFDQFVLVEVTNPPIVVTEGPSPALWLSGTHLLSASAMGGSGNYTQAEFDVNDDGSIDLTDTTAPFELSLDTTSFIPTSGTLPVKVTVTDDAAATGSVTNAYTVDNRFAGRQELLTNGDFSAWTGNTPNGWSTFMVGAGTTYYPGPGRDLPTTPSLEINNTASQSVDRYPLAQKVQNIGGIWENHQVTTWGKGSYCRVYMFSSPDDVTYTNTFVGASVNSADWGYAIGGVANRLGAQGGEWSLIAPHHYPAGSAWWDDISWKATLIPPPAGVDDWRMF